MSVAAKYKDHKILVADDGHFGLKRSIAKLCQRCTDSFSFWLIVGLVTLFEPVLCSRYPSGIIWLIQLCLLILSSFLYFIQLVGVASKEWEKISEIQEQMRGQTGVIIELKNQPLMKLFLFFTAEEEYMFEFACLLLGWALIFTYPGIAVLRCFRVFRLLWFYEVKVFRSTASNIFNPIFGKNFVNRVFNVLKFAIKALTALIDEMMRLSPDTKGGIILIMMFFYTAFIMGIVLWIETDSGSELCTSIGVCTYTLMRLTFYDGNGFDFAYFLTDKHRILFCIVMFYMALTSFGLLNGLVGIFGNVFANASEDAFGQPDEDEEEYYQDENGNGDFSPMRGDGTADDEARALAQAAYHLESRDSFAGDGLMHKQESALNDEDGEVMPFDGDVTPGGGVKNVNSFSKVAAQPRFAGGNVTFADSTMHLQMHPQNTPKPSAHPKVNPAAQANKASYADLKQLMQQTKRKDKIHPAPGATNSFAGSSDLGLGVHEDNSSSFPPQWQAGGSRKGGLFSVPQKQKSFNQWRALQQQSAGTPRTPAINNNNNNNNNSNNNSNLLYMEVKQMRDEMRAMMRMQTTLQQQLSVMMANGNHLQSQQHPQHPQHQSHHSLNSEYDDHATGKDGTLPRQPPSNTNGTTNFFHLKKPSEI